jgi:hypothetical protein
LSVAVALIENPAETVALAAGAVIPTLGGWLSRFAAPSRASSSWYEFWCPATASPRGD